MKIDEIPVARGSGTIGLTHCPGLHGAFEADLDALAGWKADAVLTLLRDEELRAVGASTLGAELHARGIAWVHLPVHDLGATDDAFIAAWNDASSRVRAIVEAGGRVAVHCRSGVGRAGNATAMLFIDAGVDADAAMALVRARRDGAISDADDEALLRAHAERRAE